MKSVIDKGRQVGRTMMFGKARSAGNRGKVRSLNPQRLNKATRRTNHYVVALLSLLSFLALGIGALHVRDAAGQAAPPRVPFL